ncbi:spore coat protein [Paenibacillus thiaminolyticus]|uniref:spore coat protein n=1 Tax=Paenibacillus thiaminolyticus TaxID=49283 RepID=UPI0011C42BEE|nr:spore coat protein [Paenibacillus thiaminolyticus]
MLAESERKKHLAWHETMEMHELTAFQANHLMAFKMMIDDVKDAKLRALYEDAIYAMENNLKDLIGYYPMAPAFVRHMGDRADMTGFYAGHLLGFCKTSVRSYAIGITETSTPSLRQTLKKQLNAAIDLHAKVFHFMLDRGYYPSYDLPKLLENDMKNANKALSM